MGEKERPTAVEGPTIRLNQQEPRLTRRLRRVPYHGSWNRVFSLGTIAIVSGLAEYQGILLKSASPELLVFCDFLLSLQAIFMLD
jgi:hypothetical protein